MTKGRGPLTGFCPSLPLWLPTFGEQIAANQNLTLWKLHPLTQAPPSLSIHALSLQVGQPSPQTSHDPRTPHPTPPHRWLQEALAAETGPS